jgi:DNA-binding transcriptional regulator YhcF (GntR family)
MKNGFGTDVGKASVIIKKEELDNLIRHYKKLKKYMKSSLYTVKSMDGTEEKIKNLLEEYGDDKV